MPSSTNPHTPHPSGPHATGHDAAAPPPPAPRPHVATIQVSRRALVELHAHATTAAYILGHIDEGADSPTVERLAAHIDAMAHGIGGLLQGGPISRPPADSAAPTDDVAPDAELADDAAAPAPTPLPDAPADVPAALPLDRLRLAMGRADALASVTDEHYSNLATDDARGRAHHAHLVELVALAVRDVVESAEAVISVLESLSEATGADRPVRPREEFEHTLDALGWRVISGPTRTAAGYTATIQRGTTSMATTGATETAVLANLLRDAEARGRRP